MPSATSTETGTFINGKAQIIELLRYLSAEERSELLSNMEKIGPQMTMELSQQGLSFLQLSRISQESLQAVIEQIAPSILGMALKDCPKSFQQNCLRLMPRQLALETYEILTTTFQDEEEKIKKAQSKILKLAIKLHQYKRIQLV